MSVNRIDDAQKAQLRQVHPRDFMPQLGAQSKGSNGSKYAEYEYQGENYRFNLVTSKKDGEVKWLVFAGAGQGAGAIGDNISFLTKCAHQTFPQALETLGAVTQKQSITPKAIVSQVASNNDYRPAADYPLVGMLPAIEQKYGVDREMVSLLVQQKFIRGAQQRELLTPEQLDTTNHANVMMDNKQRPYRHRHGLLTLGYNEEGKERFGHFVAMDGLPPFKRDTYGSKKEHAPMLFAKNESGIKHPLYISEGVGDLLAAALLYKEELGTLPNATMVGGAGLTSAIYTKRMDSLFENSNGEVYLLRQREKNPSKQAEIDVLWKKYSDTLTEKFPNAVVYEVLPEKGFKDLSDQLMGKFFLAPSLNSVNKSLSR
jgi:hypothetical protein